MYVDEGFNYVTPDYIDEIITRKINRGYDKVTYRKKQYYNIPCCFDIESTSTYIDGEKVAFMYAWTLNINGASIIGRTWEEFEMCIQHLVDKLYTNLERVFIIYVHNLGWEFAFIAKRFQWDKIFSIDDRKPIYARTINGIEFRCSLLLSGYKLEVVGKNLQKYKVLKMVGDLDYLKTRHSTTPLTTRELRYLINDGRVVVSYIQEEIERNGSIARIPLTKTGYVRLAVRRNCFSKSHRTKAGSAYRKRIKTLTIELDEYELLKDAFAGGFVHANPWYTGKILHNVSSLDFTSSYPSVMVCELYPMGKGELIEHITDEIFTDSINNYCCVFYAHFENVKPRVSYDNPISASKCKNLKNAKLNNGRVVSADSFDIALTNIDYITYKKFYKWNKKKFGVTSFYRYKAGYLPREFVDSILTFYEGKTTLKGVKGKESEYLHEKENVNSCYGMCVTDILRETIMFDPEHIDPETGHLQPWFPYGINKQVELDKYNNSSQRFLSYVWGLFVTSYARRNVLSGVLACGSDYVYSDTDSLKILNYDKHKDYFERYNRQVSKRLEMACVYHGFDVSRIRPKTIKGVEKPLGVWDNETGTPDKISGLCSYPLFKTLGAKRYMYMQDGEVHTTVAGSNKEKTAKYLVDTYGKYYAFYKFDNHLSIPKSHSGRSSSCYIDYETSGEVVDYLGNKGTFHELSSVHLEQTEYNLSLSSDYVKYFLNIQEERVH